MLRKLFIFILIFLLLASCAYAQDGIFPLSKEDSAKLFVSSITLFIAVKNTLVMTKERYQSPERVATTAINYQVFLTLFTLALDKDK